MEILRDAFYAVEAQRYQAFLEEFYERGGSRNMYLNAVDIENQLASMGLEEDIYMEGSQPPTRRRRRVPTKKRNNNSTQHDDLAQDMHIDEQLLPHTQLSQEEIRQQIQRGRPAAWAAAVAEEEGMVNIKLEPGQETHLGR